MARVVLYTFGILRAEKSDPAIREFYRRMPRVFQAAETTTGFIDRREDGDFTLGPRFFDKTRHVRAPQTLSLWRHPAPVRAFAGDPAHADALPRLGEWFLEPSWPSHVLWWIEDDHVPSWPEAWAHLEALHDRGPSPEAFTLAVAFEADATPLPPFPGIARGPAHDAAG